MITAIKSQRLRTLLDHYLMVRGDKRMPSRHDIDATLLGPVLPIIWVNEYESGMAHYDAMYRKDLDHPIEKVGRELRDRMSWLKSGKKAAA